MVFRERERLAEDGTIEGSDTGNPNSEDNIAESSSMESEIGSSQNGGLGERLRNVLGGDPDADLLLEESDRGRGILQWLQVLDLQVIGACRADERLKPLLKLNVSSGVADDLLVAHLSQHFEATEVGMLARCLCIPLVSIRTGKIMKQGNTLSPSAIRGQLSLTLLPSSDMRISFVGDDGCIVRVAILRNNCNSSAIVIEEISADTSGRSFSLKLPGDQVSYYWCAEKSMVTGAELLTKMKDLLRTKPTLAQLTGISESRLDCFVSHIRTFLIGFTIGMPSNHTTTTACTPPESGTNTPLSASSSNLSLPWSMANQRANQHSSLTHCNHSPRSNTFKDDLPRNSYSNEAGGKFMRHSDSHLRLSAIENPPTCTSCTTQMSSTGLTEADQLLEAQKDLPLTSPETLDPSMFSSFGPLPFCVSLSQEPGSSCSLPTHSPYYCWCPPGSSSLQYTVTTPQLPPAPFESLPLPSLSSLLKIAARSSNAIVVSSPKPPPDLAANPLLDFPALLPEPLVRFPLPASSFTTSSSPHVIPAFTPYISDPIVHIPVVDICSSAQGYLVSAGPAISSAMSPLLPNLVSHCLLADSESLVEKSARDTLHLLIGSDQTNFQLMGMLPAVFSPMDGNLFCVQENKRGSTLVNGGSRGLYSRAREVDAIANSASPMGIVSQSGRSTEVRDNLINKMFRKYDGVDLDDEDTNSVDDDHGGWIGDCI